MKIFVQFMCAAALGFSLYRGILANSTSVALLCTCLAVASLALACYVQRRTPLRRCPHCFSRVVRQRVARQEYDICSGCGWRPDRES